MRQLLRFTLWSILLATTLSACNIPADRAPVQSAPPSTSPDTGHGVSAAPWRPQRALPPTQQAVAQTVYVPAYSYIYFNLTDRPQVIDLAVTLSVRNTSINRPITLTSVTYHDSEGTWVRQYLDAPQTLAPLASTAFVVAKDDRTGGAGANFIVEWEADAPVAPPVIESVMISTQSALGISFTSPGRVIRSAPRPTP
ncbi:DUF3124 domain-containing protein [Salisaeta longa]|uniref:DUF3124 domain-containing protein n=1 Tax=Salisaeta longa TaxID=503170 RepID=UPI0003FB3C25|nr:DUF3124 domain-containing protein [Salisaeta longa]